MVFINRIAWKIMIFIECRRYTDIHIMFLIEPKRRQNMIDTHILVGYYYIIIIILISLRSSWSHLFDHEEVYDRETLDVNSLWWSEPTGGWNLFPVYHPRWLTCSGLGACLVKVSAHCTCVEHGWHWRIPRLWMSCIYCSGKSMCLRLLVTLPDWNIWAPPWLSS